jgi:hypothetical protein
MGAVGLMDDVRRLALPAGRAVGSRGHDAARAFLAGRMEAVGLEPLEGGSFEQPYGGAGEGYANLLGRIPGRDADLPALLVGAHYDTAGPQPGAGDNAAAVAIALGLAEPLRARGLARDLIVALFDGEEPPHYGDPRRMGSLVFCRRRDPRTLHAAIVMDLVGHAPEVPGMERVLLVTGMEHDRGFERALESTGEPAALAVAAVPNALVGWDPSDHLAFHEARVPFLFLTGGTWSHYHRPTDTPERLDPGRIEAVRDLLLGWIPRLDGERLDEPFEGLPLSLLPRARRALGPAAAHLGFPLETAADLERLGAHLRELLAP